MTIATNMAGRGTDIVLGGNPEFMAAAEAGTRDPNDPELSGGAGEVSRAMRRASASRC